MSDKEKRRIIREMFPEPAIEPPTVDSDLRTVEVFQGGGKWATVPWDDLKKNMIFRLREPTGELAAVGTEHEISVAMAGALPASPPVRWGIECESFTIVTKDTKVKNIKVLDAEGNSMGFVEKINMREGLAWQRSPEGLLDAVLFQNVIVDMEGDELYKELTVPGHKEEVKTVD